MILRGGDINWDRPLFQHANNSLKLYLPTLFPPSLFRYTLPSLSVSDSLWHPLHSQFSHPPSLTLSHYLLLYLASPLRSRVMLSIIIAFLSLFSLSLFPLFLCYFHNIVFLSLPPCPLCLTFHPLVYSRSPLSFSSNKRRISIL